jgi:hypothetical protein
MAEGIEIISDAGKGKAIIVVYEKRRNYSSLATAVIESLPKTSRLTLLAVEPFDEKSWQKRASQLEETITDLKVRYGCFLTFGGVSALVQHLYLALPKTVRSLVLVDATTRPHPSLLTRILSSLEAHLPIGLPFRSSDAVFNGKPFLQRFRCPVLILSTDLASHYQKLEAEILLNTLPTSWKKGISGTKPELEIPQLVIDFQSVAAKSPQRARSEENQDPKKAQVLQNTTV